MAEIEPDRVSDGSDVEVEGDEEHVLEGGDADGVPENDPLENVHDSGDDSDEDDYDFRGFVDDWVYGADEFQHVQKLEYAGPKGPTTVHPADATPLDYFQDFWTEEMWDHLILETNR